VASLAVPNFRLYLAGQAVSLPGTWMQVVAQSWLVLQLTGSGTLLGLVAAAQFLPVLLLGPYGGLVADRVSKRPLLLVTQGVLGLLALTLGLLTVTHVVTLWMVFTLAVALGVVNSVDQPARQTFVPEIVGRDNVQNAVSLNSVLTNASRAVRPGDRRRAHRSGWARHVLPCERCKLRGRPGGAGRNKGRCFASRAARQARPANCGRVCATSKAASACWCRC